MYLQLNKCDYIFYINNYDDSIKVNSKIELIDCETKIKHIGTVRKIENDLAQFLSSEVMLQYAKRICKIILNKEDGKWYIISYKCVDYERGFFTSTYELLSINEITYMWGPKFGYEQPIFEKGKVFAIIK